MPRRGRGGDDALANGDDAAPAASSGDATSNPWKQYEAACAGAMTNLGLFASDPHEITEVIRSAMGLPKRPIPGNVPEIRRVTFVRVQRNEGGSAELERVGNGVREVAISEIIASTTTVYDLQRFLNRHVILIRGNSCVPAFDLLLVMFSVVYATVLNEDAYVRRAVLTPTRNTTVITARLAPGARVISGERIATVCFETNPGMFIPIPYNNEFFRSPVFCYSHCDPTLVNPISRAGRADAAARRTADQGSVLYTGQQPPYPRSAIDELTRLSDGELRGYRDRLMRESRSWKLLIEHLCKMTAPCDAAKELYSHTRDESGKSQWERLVDERESDAMSILYWLAFAVQTCQQARSMPVFISATEQCGKGTFFHILTCVLGSLVLHASTEDALGNFNGNIRGRLIVIIDECIDLFLNHVLYPRVQKLTASSVISAVEKNKMGVEIPNQANVMGAFNHVTVPQPARAPPSDLRRPWPIPVTGRLADDTAWFNLIYTTFADPRACMQVWIILSLIDLPSEDFIPFNSMSTGVVRNRRLMMTLHTSHALETLFETVKDMLEPQTVAEVVKDARDKRPASCLARRCLAGGGKGTPARPLLQHLVEMNVCTIYLNDEGEEVLAPVARRDKPVLYKRPLHM